MIRIENLHVFYQTARGSVHAVRGIHVDIAQGQFFTPLGPSRVKNCPCAMSTWMPRTACTEPRAV